jgi:peptidoglycan/xylan/chitin deacetylase (PgdA/CDA1 family)
MLFRTMLSSVSILLGACAAIIPASAQPPIPAPRVLAWNGRQGAVSLTFDDGEPVHLDIAVPALNQRRLRGTFFLIANQVTRLEEWRKVPAGGHEIGSHSLDHKHASELSPASEVEQVREARTRLDADLPAPALTFAYPFVEISPGLKAAVGRFHFLARGGGGAPYLKPEAQPDWLNIPSQVTLTVTPLAVYRNWVDTALKEGAWTVFTIHSIENPQPWYEPMPKATFLGLLDHLVRRQRDGLWVAPFGEVGAYWQAQKILEAAFAGTRGMGHSARWAWTVPAVFPRGVVLKVRLDGEGSWQVSQAGQILQPDAEAVYSVAFDLKEISISPTSPRAALKD